MTNTLTDYLILCKNYFSDQNNPLIKTYNQPNESYNYNSFRSNSDKPVRSNYQIFGSRSEDEQVRSNYNGCRLTSENYGSCNSNYNLTTINQGDSVILIIRTGRDEYLLVRHLPGWSVTRKDEWGWPGGGIDQKDRDRSDIDTLLNTANREFNEEVGHNNHKKLLTKQNLLFIKNTPDKAHNYYMFFDLPELGVLFHQNSNDFITFFKNRLTPDETNANGFYNKSTGILSWYSYQTGQMKSMPIGKVYLRYGQRSPGGDSSVLDNNIHTRIKQLEDNYNECDLTTENYGSCNYGC